MNLEELLKQSKEFNEILYGASVGNEPVKELLMRDLILSMVREVADLSLVTASNSLPTEEKTSSSDSNKKDWLLYQSVDIIKYALAIMNLVDIDGKALTEAFSKKDIYLRRKYFTKPLPKDTTILIVDIDDVLNNFRDEFHDFIKETYGIELASNSYYSTVKLKNLGIYPDLVYKEFIERGFLQRLKYNEEAVSTLNSVDLPIVLLTSRPSSNLTCLYDTYWWLEQTGLKYHSLNFSPEKYLWVSQQNYSGVVAIDDSPKHALEYATHGVTVLCPKANYNEHCSHEKIIFYGDNCEHSLATALECSLQQLAQ